MAEHKRVIQVLLACVFTAMLGLGIIGPIMPLYARDLGATFVQIGLLSSAWSMARLLFTPLVGRLSDTSSKKRIIAAGLAVYAVVSVLYALAWDFTSLVSIRVLHGLGSAMSMPIAMAYAAELAPEGEEGKYMGTINLAMFAGMGMGPLIGGSLTDLFSMSFPFYVMGALTALSLILTMVFLPEERKSLMKKGGAKPSFMKVLSNRLLRAAFVYRVVVAISMGSIMSFLSIFISGSPDQGGLGLPVSIAGLILSLGQVSSALLQRPFGVLADRFSKVRLTLMGGFLSSVGFTLFTFTSNVLDISVAQLIFGAGSALGMPALTAIVAIEGRKIGMGTTMSVLDSAMSLGMIVGPMISGIIVDSLGLRPIFFVGGAVTLAGTLIFYVLYKKGKQKKSADATVPG